MDKKKQTLYSYDLSSPYQLKYYHNIFLLTINIAPERGIFLSTKKYWYFSSFSTKKYFVGTHKKCLSEELLMSI